MTKKDLLPFSVRNEVSIIFLSCIICSRFFPSGDRVRNDDHRMTIVITVILMKA